MKKRIFLFTTLFALITFFIVSCSKELSVENGIPDVQAEGSLQDSNGVCYSDSIHGTFYNAITPGSDTCFVSIQVNVTKAGTYKISTDYQNGMGFSDSGFFSSTGLQTVNLKPIGTPIINVPTDYIYTFDTTVCGFTLDVQDSTGTGLGTKDFCYPANISGTYYNGITPGIDTCFVTIQVNVATPGVYIISTDVQNGFQFADSGTFTSTGLQTVTLTPNGTPITTGLTNFNYTYGSITCGFSVDVSDSTGHSGGLMGGDTTDANTWKFTDSTNNKKYFGDYSIAGASVSILTTVWNLHILGNLSTSVDTTFYLGVDLAGPDILPGTYYTNTSDGSGFALADGSGAVQYLHADIGTPQKITVVITSYDSVTKYVKGYFYGQALDSMGNVVEIRHGAFNVVVN